MTKLKAIMLTTRANDRLKVVSDTCLAFACDDSSSLGNDKQFNSLLTRIKKELKSKEPLHNELITAFVAFNTAYQQSKDKQELRKLADDVARAARNVQTLRWIKLKKQHGEISHYFDDFGQIHTHYQQRYYLKHGPEKAHHLLDKNLKYYAIALFSSVLCVWWLIF